MLEQEHKDLESVIFYDQDDSGKCYLLGNEVYFFPGKNILYNINTKKNVTIFSPASRILDFLILNRGTTVAQRELINAGWGEKSELVSMNTYYQCMLKLRRAFIEIGHNDEIIKTVTRKGVLLVSDVAIKHDCEIEPLLASATPDNNNQKKKDTSSSKFRLSYYFRLEFFFLAIVVALFVVLFRIYASKEKGKENYFSLYRLHETTKNNCKIFININNRKSNIKDLYTSGIDCNSYPYIYITQHSFRPRASIFYCNNTIAKNGVCFSRFYTDGISQ